MEEGHRALPAQAHLVGHLAAPVLQLLTTLKGTGVAVEYVHAKGTRGEKVLEVCLGLKSPQVEHFLPMEFYKLERALHIHVPFEGILGESQRVEICWSEDLGNARLHSGWSRGVKLDDLGHQVLEVLVLSQWKRLVSQTGNIRSEPGVEQQGHPLRRTVLEHRSVRVVVGAVVHSDLAVLM